MMTLPLLMARSFWLPGGLVPPKPWKQNVLPGAAWRSDRLRGLLPTGGRQGVVEKTISKNPWPGAGRGRATPGRVSGSGSPEPGRAETRLDAGLAEVTACKCGRGFGRAGRMGWPGWGRGAANPHLRAGERVARSEPRLLQPGPGGAGCQSGAEPSRSRWSCARVSRRARPARHALPGLGEQPLGCRAAGAGPLSRCSRAGPRREPKAMAAGKFASLPRNMPMNHQFPLASSMDLLSSKSPLVERRADAYQDVSIHGTLPRKKKGPPSPLRSYDHCNLLGTLPHSKSLRHVSPLSREVIQENPAQDWQGKSFFRDQHLLDQTPDYVKGFAICVL